MAIHGRNRDKIAAALVSNRPFDVGNAMTAIEGKGGEGRLPHNIAKEYRAADVVYTVYSYGTPIAWVLRGGRVRIPNLRYSVTTTNHQGLCRVYLAGERGE